MTNNNISTNPWPGIISYEDPAKSQNKRKFCGRDNDIYDMSRLIDDNLLVILYGKSGIGKTSLLNAGVFPTLRKELYVPVNIRLGTYDATVLYQEVIITAIEKAVTEIGGSVRIIDVVEEKPIGESQQPDYLWNYFARHRFFNAKAQTVFPVIVLDQFEELLRYSREDNHEMAEALLSQIQYLVDDSHALNECIVNGETYNYDFNFRFVISIREDELYLLEDRIDSLGTTAFKRCRYRLRSLSEEGAKTAILIPGMNCIDEKQRDSIVEKIITLSTRPVNGEIDTLLLSLVCARTFDKKLGNKITLTDLSVWKSNNPMEVYYQDAIKVLSPDKVRYIQQNLIREDGSRKRVDVKEAKKEMGDDVFFSLTQGENRMLVIGECEQVELLHDQLALAVYEERKAFEERERKRKLRKKAILGGAVSIFIIGVFVFLSIELNYQSKVANKARTIFLLEKSKNLYNENNRLAQLLLLETFKNIGKIGEPYIAEAEQALRLFSNSNVETIRFDNNTTTGIHGITERHQTPNYTPVHIKVEDKAFDTIIVDNDHVYYSSFSKEGNHVFSVSGNTIKIWDVKSKKLMQLLFLEYPDSFFEILNNRIKGDSLRSKELWELLINQEFNLEPEIINAYYENSCYEEYNGRFRLEFIIPNQIKTPILDPVLIEVDLKMIKNNKDAYRALRLNDNSIISIRENTNGIVYAESINGTRRSWDIKNGNMTGFCEGYQWKFKHIAESHATYDHLPEIVIDNLNNVGKYEHANDHINEFNCVYSPLENSHEGDITSISVKPDDNQFVSASSDSTIIVWDVVTGNVVYRIKGHNGGVNSAYYSPNGKYIVSASDDSYVKVWNADEGTEICSFIGHQGKVLHAEFSPDNRYIVSSSDDGTIRIWDFPPLQELIDQTRERFKDRPLTAEERRMYYLE